MLHMYETLRFRPMPHCQQDFLVSSVFLKQVGTWLTTHPDRHERLAAISGVVTPTGTVVPSIMQRMDASKSTPTYVQAQPAQTYSLIDNLVSDYEHQVWGFWHSHILRGRQSTKPSHVDLRHQNRLVDIGMPHVLGGIFCLDGWARVFSTAVPFSLSVYGAGAEVIEDTPYETILKIDLKESEHATAE